jgi:predicted  nucleic acid-binding Zn-ribbon protein
MGTSLYENSNYSGKGSASTVSHREEKTERSNNKYEQMRKVLEVAEELEEAKAALVGAEKNVKKVEEALRREVRKLDPETRARFMSIFDDVGPGGEDR